MEFERTIKVPITHTKQPMSQPIVKMDILANKRTLSCSSNGLNGDEAAALSTNRAEVETQTLKSFNYNRRSAGQLMNDLNYLNKTKMAPSNVHFKFLNGKVVSLHSFILLAR